MSKNRKPVEIEWDDACSVGGTWVDVADVTSKRGRALVRIRSVGYVLRADKKVVVLAASYHHERAGDVQNIPTGSIVHTRRLR